VKSKKLKVLILWERKISDNTLRKAMKDETKENYSCFKASKFIKDKYKTDLEKYFFL
jgi:outer membrane protein insertion porin family